MKTYTSMLPLSYMVPTFYPTLPGNVQAVASALMVPLDDPDLQARAQRLVNVLYWTANQYQNHDGMDDPNTLKVFIAPEFYFRKSSAEESRAGGPMQSTSFGSYPDDARYYLAEVLYQVLSTTPLFRDWVIVAGSICSALPTGPGGRMNLLNTTIMLRGQRPVLDASVPYVLMEKRYISNIDGPQMQANRDPTTIYSFRQNPDQSLDNIVFWDGMKVGLEVCLDHGMQVVSNAVNFIDQAVGPGAGTLDLQLVTSCGMSIVDQAVSVADGALIMLTDGMSHQGSGLPEPVFQVGRYNAKTGRTNVLDSDLFSFAELPKNSNYQVPDYAQGRYAAKGRRQGVYTSKSKLALVAPV
jgi:hypothetical protein